MTNSPVRVLDCTLREGSQAPGVTFSTEHSEEIAAWLAACGVDMIECGHPAASLAEKARVKAAVAGAAEVPVLAHARATEGDVAAALDAGAAWVGILLGFNEYSRPSRVAGASVADLLGMASRAVSYAVSRGLGVRFTVEDASRTDPEVLDQAFATALGAGAGRLCFADTVGVAEPADVAAAVRRLRARFPSAELEFQPHNDRGLAVANALAAVDAGADWISCSVNGLGERAGVTDLAVLLANLHFRGQRAISNAAAVQRVSHLVGAIARSPLAHSHPVVGRNSFTHTSRLHGRAVHLDPVTYSWIDPALVGRETAVRDDVPLAVSDMFVAPEARSASELPHHRHGPGERYLFLDNSKIGASESYCIVRQIPATDPGPGHVDAHRHSVDSFFMFLGSGSKFTGLRAAVELAGVERVVDSPMTVFIPAGMRHSYRVVSGSGLYLNVVLAGNYHQSLLE